MTADELLAARAARLDSLRSQPLVEQVAALSFPTLADLGTGAAPVLEEALAAFQLAELWLWPGQLRYCHRELLDYVYVPVGDRHPRKDYREQANRRQLSWLAAEVFDLLLAALAPMTSAQLRDRMGAERTSALTIEHALHELARTLKVLRCGRSSAGDPLWRPLVLALPAVPPAIDRVSQVQAAAALLTHHLETALCATEEELADFFFPLFSRTRIHEALTGLEATRHLLLDNLDGRPAFRLE